MKKYIVTYHRIEFMTNALKIFYSIDAPVRLIVRTAGDLLNDKTLNDVFSELTTLANRAISIIGTIALQDMIPSSREIKVTLLNESMPDVIKAVPEMLQFIDEVVELYTHTHGAGRGVSTASASLTAGMISDPYFLYWGACISFKYSFFHKYGTLDECEKVLVHRAMEAPNIKSIILYVHTPGDTSYVTTSVDGKFPRNIDREIDSVTRKIIILETKMIRGEEKRESLVKRKYILESLYKQVAQSDKYAHDVKKDTFDSIVYVTQTVPQSFTKTLSVSESGSETVFSFVMRHTDKICTLLTFNDGSLWKNELENAIRELVVDSKLTRAQCLYNTDSLLKKIQSVI
jgi:hypothetical protein